MKRLKRILSAWIITLSTLALAAPVAAANGYELFGEASTVSPGNASATAVQLVSDADPGSGGIDFDVAAGTTFANLTTLGSDFNVLDDDCGGGSPRFQINVDIGGGTEKNIFVYLGPSPNYTGCTANTWTTSGDLLASGNTVDTSQLTGGTFYDQYDDALAEFGTLPVTGLQLVVDSSWFFLDGEQTVLADNVVINDTTFDFEAEVDMPTTKDECKKGGWQDFDGVFKNQGDCVSFVATAGRNQPANNPTF